MSQPTRKFPLSIRAWHLDRPRLPHLHRSVVVVSVSMVRRCPGHGIQARADELYPRTEGKLAGFRDTCWSCRGTSEVCQRRAKRRWTARISQRSGSVKISASSDNAHLGVKLDAPDWTIDSLDSLDCSLVIRSCAMATGQHVVPCSDFELVGWKACGRSQWVCSLSASPTHHPMTPLDYYMLLRRPGLTCLSPPRYSCLSLAMIR